MTRTIRVLVAEDSLTVRKRLVEVLSQDPALEVVGEAQDGQQAIDMCERLRPDVVTLDMMMPGTTGVAATEHIMAYRPTPILIVSASTNRGELFRTYDALAAGALDVIEKPRADEDDVAWGERLRAAVKLVSRIKVIMHPRARLARMAAAPAPGAGPAPGTGARPAVVAIGGSTGSTAGIVEVLRALPPDFGVPILLVIHVNEPFGAAFTEWLDRQSPLRVRYARDGEPLATPGAALVRMAPPGTHLALKRGALRLGDEPQRHSCKPSVDVLFESVAAEAGAGAVACLLSGMGRDGAAGMLAVRRAGGATIAQDEASCVVFGMPREAILLGAAERVLPLGAIGAALVEATRRGATP